MPKRKFDSSDEDESSTSLPKENFIAKNNKKKQVISLKRREPSISSDSDSENEQQTDKEEQTASHSQNRQMKMKTELIESTSKSKNVTDEKQLQLNNANKSNREVKDKQSSNNKKLRVEAEPDIDDRASSSISVNAHHALPRPKDMYNFFKLMTDLSSDGKLQMAGKKGNCKFDVLFKDQTLDPTIDLGAMQNALSTVYRYATALSETPMFDALSRVMDYVKGEQILQKYPDYPKKINSKWNIFLKNHGKTPFNAGEKLKLKFRDKEDDSVKNADGEYLKSLESYIAEMREYIDRNKDQLFNSQIEYLENKIKKMANRIEKKEKKKERAIGNPKVAKQVRNKIMKEEKPTPFELFKMTMTEKYVDLSEEKRHAKLIKKFNKLDEAEKAVFEKISNRI